MNTQPRFTSGPWDVDRVHNDGDYGSAGPDAHSGFNSFAVFDATGATLFDSLNSDAACIEEHHDEDHHDAWDETARQNLTLAAAAPEMYAALEPFAAHCSSEETITITVRTTDVARARAALAKAVAR